MCLSSKLLTHKQPPLIPAAGCSMFPTCITSHIRALAPFHRYSKINTSILSRLPPEATYWTTSIAFGAGLPRNQRTQHAYSRELREAQMWTRVLARGESASGRYPIRSLARQTAPEALRIFLTFLAVVAYYWSEDYKKHIRSSTTSGIRRQRAPQSYY